jgi:hypothetical protein
MDPGRQCFRLRQAVSISGLGSPEFDKIIPMVDSVYYMFLPHFTEGTLETFQLSQFQGHDVLCTHSRIFTSRSLAPNALSTPFSEMVDPDNNLTKLARLASSKFVHTWDNEVEYIGPLANNSNKLSRML